jgi:hypothetical protein
MGAVRLKSALRGASEAFLVQGLVARIVPNCWTINNSNERTGFKTSVSWIFIRAYCAILSGRNGMRSRYHIISVHH